MAPVTAYIVPAHHATAHIEVEAAITAIGAIATSFEPTAIAPEKLAKTFFERVFSLGSL